MARKSVKKSDHPPVVDLSSLPAVVTLPEVAAIYRISARTVRDRLKVREFLPEPFDNYPWRWRRDDIIRDLENRKTKLKTRAHGFAAAKAKRERQENATAE